MGRYLKGNSHELNEDTNLREKARVKWRKQRYTMGTGRLFPRG
jgi:hypothetical protein